MSSILTDIGKSKLASATPEDQLTISHVAVGDGNGGYPPLVSSMTALTNEVWRGDSSAPIREGEFDNILIFEGFIPADTGGFDIREMAIFDDEGDMIAIGHTSLVEKPAAGGVSGIDLAVRMHVALESASQIDLIYNQIGFVDHQGLTGRSSADAHPASSITTDALALLGLEAGNLWGVLEALKVGAVTSKADTAKAESLDNDDAFLTAFRVVQHLKANMEMTGAAIAFTTTVPPNGFLKANGAAVSRTAYSELFNKFGTFWGSGDGSTTFNLPDFRGEFIRGWDDGRGIDSGRDFGTVQEATKLGLVSGSYGNNVQGMTFSDGPDGTVDLDTGSFTGSVDTFTYYKMRPRNVALVWYIKY